MLRIAVVPSASYLAPGSVITSILLIVEAGIALRISLRFCPERLGSGCPFLYTLKLVEPWTLMFSCPSTVTRGIFLSISKVVFVCAVLSCCTSYVSLSISFLISWRLCATTTSSNFCVFVESVLVVFWAVRAVTELQAVSNSINLFHIVKALSLYLSIWCKDMFFLNKLQFISKIFLLSCLYVP